MMDTETFTYSKGSYANEKMDVVDYSLNRADVTGRYLFVSDLHYVLAERNGQINRTDFRGYTTDERMQELCNDIRREYARRGLDGVFVLGDLSTDDWYPGIGSSTGYVKNSCEVDWNKYLKPLQEELGIPVGIIGGNHDSYPDDVWFAFAGREKQFSMVFGDTAIIMMDTYDTDPKKGSRDDGNYANGVGCSIDIPGITAELEKYKDKENVIIASHYFKGNTELANLVKNYDNVICMLDGHTHHFVTSKFGTSNVTYVNTGTYSYGAFDGRDFNGVCSDCGAYGCLWGFQIIETTLDGATTYRVDTDRTYTFGNGLVIDALYKKYEETKLK
jgi:predicted phosphodiesterase